MVSGWLDKLLGVMHAIRLALSSKTEISLTDDCIREVEKKRKHALERSEAVGGFVEKYGKVISEWKEDDRYADEGFYRKKLAECYEENRPVKRAIGLP
jgi:hypothetical protein